MPSTTKLNVHLGAHPYAGETDLVPERILAVDVRQDASCCTKVIDTQLIVVEFATSVACAGSSRSDPTNFLRASSLVYFWELIEGWATAEHCRSESFHEGVFTSCVDSNCPSASPFDSR